MPPELVAGDRMATIEDAHEVRALNRPRQTEYRRCVSAPHPCGFSAGRVVVGVCLRLRFIKVLHTVPHGHELEDADNAARAVKRKGSMPYNTRVWTAPSDASS